MVRLTKIFKWFFVIVAGLFGLAAIASAVIFSLGITINLDTVRPAVETAVSAALGRDTRITGSQIFFNPHNLAIKGIYGIIKDNNIKITNSFSSPKR